MVSISDIGCTCFMATHDIVECGSLVFELYEKVGHAPAGDAENFVYALKT
jgi:hypothetical protein